MIQRAGAGDELKVYYISVDRVGVDILDTFIPKYTTPPKLTQTGVSQHKVILLLLVYVLCTVLAWLTLFSTSLSMKLQEFHQNQKPHSLQEAHPHQDRNIISLAITDV